MAEKGLVREEIQEFGPFTGKDGRVFKLKVKVEKIEMLRIVGAKESVKNPGTGRFGPWKSIPVPGDKK